jgi:hypothetical protein
MKNRRLLFPQSLIEREQNLCDFLLVKPWSDLVREPKGSKLICLTKIYKPMFSKQVKVPILKYYLAKNNIPQKKIILFENFYFNKIY